LKILSPVRLPFRHTGSFFFRYRLMLEFTPLVVPFYGINACDATSNL